MQVMLKYPFIRDIMYYTRYRIYTSVLWLEVCSNNAIHSTGRGQTNGLYLEIMPAATRIVVRELKHCIGWHRNDIQTQSCNY